MISIRAKVQQFADREMAIGVLVVYIGTSVTKIPYWLTLLVKVVAVAVISAEAQLVRRAIVSVVEGLWGVVVVHAVPKQEVASESQEHHAQDDRRCARKVERLRQTRDTLPCEY